MTVVRSLAFVALFYVWSATLAILFLPLMLAPLPVILRAFKLWSLGVMALLRACCGVRVELRGKAHVPTGPAVIAAKHQCMFDVFAQFAWLDAHCFVMKRELLWIPVFGWYARRTGMITLDRKGRSDALRKLMRAAKTRIDQGRQVVIFPEGTRGQPGRAGQYQVGVAALYRELDLPVIPVATNSGLHWPAHGFIRKPGKVVFEFLEPIPPGLKRAEFMAELERRIETASRALL